MTHDEQRPISDLEQANSAVIECDEKGCIIVKNDYKPQSSCEHPHIEIKSFASRNPKPNIYFNKNSLEHSIFRFCKKYRFSVRATISLLSLFSVVVCGVAIAGVADFLINNAIFSIVESVGILGE